MGCSPLASGRPQRPQSGPSTSGRSHLQRAASRAPSRSGSSTDGGPERLLWRSDRPDFCPPSGFPGVGAPMRRFASITASGALLIVGCGGNEETKTVTVRGTDTTAASEPHGISKTEAKRVAKSAALQLEDFPSGWQQKDQDPSDNKADTEACPQITAAKEATLARAASDDFSDDEDQEASAAIYVYGTEAETERHFPALSSYATRSCSRTASRNYSANNSGRRMQRRSVSRPPAGCPRSRSARKPLHRGSRSASRTSSTRPQSSAFHSYALEAGSRSSSSLTREARSTMRSTPTRWWPLYGASGTASAA